MKNPIKILRNKLVSSLRRLYHKIKKAGLKNESPTIISSNCTGTFICRDMDMEFMMPTINLLFPKSDFRKFVNDLKGFIDSDVYEVVSPNKKYPVGVIYSNGEKV